MNPSFLIDKLATSNSSDMENIRYVKYYFVVALWYISLSICTNHCYCVLSFLTKEEYKVVLQICNCFKYHIQKSCLISSLLSVLCFRFMYEKI